MPAHVRPAAAPPPGPPAALRRPAAAPAVLVARPETGAPPRTAPLLTGVATKPRCHEPGLRERLFLDWIETSAKGELFAYHRAESFARDAEADPELAELGETIRRRSTGHFQVVTDCGHTRGSVTFRSPYDGPDISEVMFSGDLLFQGSIGRTDLPGGDHPTMLHSLRTKVLTLPDDIVVLPGHGDQTTIGRERAWLELVRDAGRLIA